MNRYFRLLMAVPIILYMVSCKQRETNPVEKFFPVLSFLQSQVASIDTSLYSIKKIVFVDSARTDTIYVHRDQFRKEAFDFLSIPDIAASKYSKRYKEEKQIDEMLNRVILIYTPLEPQKEVIQRQEVLIKQDPSGDNVTNIIINTLENSRDSMVEKKMLWKIDESFLVTKTKQLAGKPETTSTVKVIWNEGQ